MCTMCPFSLQDLVVEQLVHGHFAQIGLSCGLWAFVRSVEEETSTSALLAPDFQGFVLPATVLLSKVIASVDGYWCMSFG